MLFRRSSLVFILLVGMLVTTGCFGTPNAAVEQTETITGIVTYTERLSLSEHDVLTVWINEGTHKTIARIEIPTDGRQVPIPFEISYNLAEVDPDFIYYLYAKIDTLNDNVALANIPGLEVTVTGEVSSDVEIVVKRVSDAALERIEYN